MADATLVTPAPKKGRGWLRAIAWVFGILIVLLVLVYFVATSSAFFKSVILPRVGKAVNAQVTVRDASISPFSQVILRDLKLQPTGAEPLVTAAEVRLRYSLIDIIKGNLHVDEAALVSPTVTLIENADGSSNLDPLLKAQPQKAPAKQPAAPAKPSVAKPLQVDLRKFALTDATIRRVKNYGNGTRDVAELSHVNLTLDDLKNGQTGKLALSADISLQQTNVTLQAKLAGNFALALAADLKPASIRGTTRLDVTQAEGALADAAGFSSELNVEATPTDLKEVAVRFQKSNANLGELRVSGPFDMQKLEGRLSIRLAGIDKQLLNLAGAKNGMDFGGTTISSTNEVELAKGGSMITAKGEFDVSNFQLTRMNQTTPRLDLRKDYDITVDRGQSTATLRSLAVTGTQNGNALLKAELTSPMEVSWGNTSNAVGDSALTLTVTSLNLADWRPFVGDVAPAGLVSLTAKVLSQQGGKLVTLNFDSRIEHLSVNAGSNHISDATITMQAGAMATDLKRFNLTDYKLEVAHQNETLTSVTASGTYDQATGAADMRVALQAALAPLLRTVPQPGMQIASGTVELKAHITQNQKTQAATGNLALANFSGGYGTNELRSLGTAVDFDIGITSQQIQIRKLAGKLTQGGNPVGSFDVSGTYDSGATNADVQATAQLALAALAQAVRRPDVTVSSGTLELKTHLTQKQKAQAVTGSLALEGFTGGIGTNEVRSLGTAVDFDIGMASQQVQIRKLAGKLTQGGNAAGSFDLSGTYDSGTTNADLQATAQLALAALAQAAPRPEVSVSSGNIELKAHVTQKQKTQAFTGSLALEDFTGRFGTNAVRSLGTAVDFDLGMTAQQAQIRKLTGKLTQGANVGGSFDVSGTYGLLKANADLSAKLTDFNQNALGPFLQPVLGDKKLVSLAINANATAHYDPEGASAVKADLQVTNLVVKDPKGQFPATPLAAKMQVDASLQKQVADVRQFQVTLTPTARATNQLQLSGHVDMSLTNAIQGNLKLAADSLDFTGYYDLFIGGKQTSEKGDARAAPQTARTSAPTPTPANADKEPDPITLPLSNFTAQVSIRRLYLREVDIADWQATTKIDGGHVVVNPFKLTLNGAPVNSTVDLDLGVPGWKYDVSLSALAIPLTPLVDTFQPESKGQVGGTTTAKGQLRGYGITSASLQKNLAGQFAVNSTNLNLNVVNIKSPMLRTLINVVAGIPELLQNPTGAVGSLLGGLFGKAGTSGGLADDLQRSPIDAIVLGGKVGTGRVDLQQATVQSAAFKADAGGGVITLAPVLTNSAIQIPVAVSLSQPIAQRMGLASASTANQTAYAKLPDFLTMTGTVGAPKTKIDYLALAGAAGKGVTGANQGQGGGMGGALGNILGIKPAGTTNQPPATQSPVDSLINGLLGPKKK